MSSAIGVLFVVLALFGTATADAQSCSVVVNAPAQFCVNQQASVTVQPPASGSWTAVEWSITGGVFTDGTGITYTATTAPSVTVLANGGGPVTLTTRATDSSGCTTSNVVTVVPVADVAGPVINAPSSVCPWASSVASIAPPASGSWVDVSWTIANGSFRMPNGSTSPYASGVTVEFESNNTGPVTLYATAQHSSGCPTPEASAVVAIRTIAPPVINAPAEVCPNAQATASIDPPAEGGWQMIGWSIENGFFVDGNGNQTTFINGFATVTFTATGSGPVRLWAGAEDTDGCNAPMTSRDVAIRTIAPAVINAPAEVCPNTPATASIDPPAAGGWQMIGWSIENGFFVDGNGNQTTFINGFATVTFTATGTGPVRLWAGGQDTNGCNAPMASREVAIRTIASPVINAPAQVCPWSPATASIDPPAEGGWQMTGWSIANGYFIDGNGNQTTFINGMTTVTFIANATGPVTLWAGAQDTNGCMAPMASKEVAIRTVAPPVITAPSQICPWSPGSASIAPPAEGSWVQVSWSISGGRFFDAQGYPTNYISGATSVSFSIDGSMPATITVAAQDSFGCSTSQSSVQVTARTVPPPVITAPSQLCPWSPGSASIAPPAEGSWVYVSWSISGGQFYNAQGYPTNYISGSATDVSFSINGSMPATITVTAQDSFGCSTSQSSVQVTARTVPPPVITAPSQICPWFPATASIAPPAEGSWVYVGWSITGGSFVDQWGYRTQYISGSATSVPFSIDGSMPATITVTAQDSFGCSTTQSSVQIAARTVPPPTITAPSQVCPWSTSSASIAPPAEGSWVYAGWSITGGYFVDQWGNQTTYISGPTTVSFHAGDGSMPVTITVAAQDSNGCSTMQSTATIAIRSIAAPTIDAPATVCPNGSASVSLQPPAEGSWASGTWAITGGYFVDAFGNHTGIAGPTTVNFTADGSGPVVITADGRDNLGCLSPQGTVTIPLETNAAPQIALASSPVCQQVITSATVTNASEFASIDWSVSGPAYITSNTYSGPTIEFYVFGDGPVTLTATATGSMCGGSTTIDVPTNPGSEPSITPSEPIPFCPNTPLTLTASDGASWLWNTGSTTRSIVITRGAEVSVTITDANGCSRTTSLLASERPAPEVNVAASGPTRFCEGGSVVLTADGYFNFDAATYVWTNGATTRSITVTQPGTYGVTANFNNGCSSTASAVTVTVDPSPEAVITADQPVICAGNPVMLTASAGGDSYLWSTGATTPYMTTDQPGSYTVTVTKGNCSKTSAPFTVTTGTLPSTVPALDVYYAQLCPNGTGTATVLNPGTFARIQWVIDNGTIVGPNDQPTVTYTVGSVNANVVARGYSATGCFYGMPVQVQVGPPSSEFDYSPLACAGTPAYASQTAPSATAQFAWSVTNAQIVSGANSSGIIFIADGTGPVTITATATRDGCSSTTTHTVEVDSLGTPTITAPASVCSLTGHTASASDMGEGAQYWWSISGGTLTSSGYGRTVTFDVDPGSLNVRLTVQVQKGACMRSAIANVLHDDPQATVTADTTLLCPGGSAQLSASDGASWLWSNGATTRWITVSQPGTYSVTITSAGGCVSTSAPVTITAETAPAPAVVISPSEVCPSQVDVIASVTNAAAYTDIYWLSNAAFINGNRGATVQLMRAWGTYVYWVEAVATTANGCTLRTRVEIPVVAGPDPTITTASSFCEGEIYTASVADAGPGATYHWELGTATVISGANTRTVTFRPYFFNNNPLNLFVDVTDGRSCSMLASVNIPVTPKPQATITAPATMCVGPAATASVPDNGAAASYQWSIAGGTIESGQGTRTITFRASAGGTVNLTATVTVNGCVTTGTKSVSATQSSSTITAGGPTTFCDGGFVTLTSSVANGTYLWSNGATTRSIDVWQSGTFSVTATDAGGCTAPSNSVTVTVNPRPATPEITASGPLTFCEGGSVTLTSTPAASYLWSNGATTQSITVSATNAYYVTVTDANGCTANSNSVNVTVQAAPPTPAINAYGPTTFCEGGSVMLVAMGANGGTYLWSNGATSQSITVSTAGTYSVTVTNAEGCSATSAPTTVSVNPNPVATITASGPTTFCAGGSVILTASPGASYEWSTGATTQSITATESSNYYVVRVTNADGCSTMSAPMTVTVNANPVASITPSGPTTFCAGGSVTLTASAAASYLWSTGATSQSITVSSSGNYSVTETNAAGCSATSAATAVTVNDNPVATISASGPTTFCAGGSVTLTASSGSSYLWSTGVTTQAIVVSQAGNYSVTVTNAAGCSTTSAATAVTVNDNPVASITASGPTTFCAGGSVTLTASSGSSYLWSTGATSQSITVSSSGNYSVTVTNAAGCSTSSTSTAVTVNANPVASITASGPTTFCEGGSVTLTASSGSSYLWSTGATSQSITVSQTGNYSVTVTNAAGCSTTSAATAVTVNANPAATISASGPTTFCEGGSVTLTASSGSSYLWSTGATTQSIAVSSAGSYSVTVTNAAGCSTTSAATAVTVNSNPAATISASGPTTFCAGGSVTLTASSGASYLWSTGATTQSIVVTSSGNYTVAVTNAAGCSTTSAATAVTVNANPAATISASGPTTFCAGGSVTLTASSGTSYLWSTGATTQSIVVTSSGNYSVAVTNAAGCSATSAATAVTVNANPVATISASGPTTFCEGGSVTLTASAGASYLWSTGATTQSIVVTSSGNYTVAVTNAAGCSTTSAATSVTVNPQPAVPVISGPTAFCPSTTITLTAPAGYASYLWSTGATSQSITVGTAGSYTVTVTNANGCSRTSAAYAVSANPATQITTQPANATIPRNTQHQLSVTATGTATLQYQWYSGVSGDTSNPIAGATSSTYTAGPFTKKGTNRFWVRVTSSTCTGSTVNSNTATVTVN